jgi:hypothetical protein
MSRQLAVSSAFSVFAMLAFALLATPSHLTSVTHHENVGISIETETPTFGWRLPAIPLPHSLFD